jgi:hypothetical protein
MCPSGAIFFARLLVIHKLLYPDGLALAIEKKLWYPRCQGVSLKKGERYIQEISFCGAFPVLRGQCTASVSYTENKELRRTELVR